MSEHEVIPDITRRLESGVRSFIPFLEKIIKFWFSVGSTFLVVIVRHKFGSNYLSFARLIFAFILIYVFQNYSIMGQGDMPKALIIINRIGSFYIAKFILGALIFHIAMSFHRAKQGQFWYSHSRGKSLILTPRLRRVIRKYHTSFQEHHFYLFYEPVILWIAIFLLGFLFPSIAILLMFSLYAFVLEEWMDYADSFKRFSAIQDNFILEQLNQQSQNAAKEAFSKLSKSEIELNHLGSFHYHIAHIRNATSPGDQNIPPQSHRSAPKNDPESPSSATTVIDPLITPPS